MKFNNNYLKENQFKSKNKLFIIKFNKMILNNQKIKINQRLYNIKLLLMDNKIKI